MWLNTILNSGCVVFKLQYVDASLQQTLVYSDYQAQLIYIATYMLIIILYDQNSKNYYYLHKHMILEGTIIDFSDCIDGDCSV